MSKRTELIMALAKKANDCSTTPPPSAATVTSDEMNNSATNGFYNNYYCEERPSSVPVTNSNLHFNCSSLENNIPECSIVQDINGIPMMTEDGTCIDSVILGEIFFDDNRTNCYPDDLTNNSIIIQHEVQLSCSEFRNVDNTPTLICHKESASRETKVLPNAMTGDPEIIGDANILYEREIPQDTALLGENNNNERDNFLQSAEGSQTISRSDSPFKGDEDITAVDENSNGSNNSLHRTEGNQNGDRSDCSIIEEDEVPAITHTKSGAIRKRKKFRDSIDRRKQRKLEVIRRKHAVLPPCNSSKCKFKCTLSFSENFRTKINSDFWGLSYINRRAFILQTCERLEIKKRTKEGDSEGYTRNNTFKYTLKDDSGVIKHVCKHFFLSTLGYKPSNDRFVYEVLSKTPKGSIAPLPDKRGKRQPTNFIPKNEINEHIESFNPVISHYRREHAPNVRYLPSDITIKSMHADFMEKFPTINVSYNVYRCEVKKKNISFSKLGNEECEHCECMKLHEHKEDQLQLESCDICRFWKQHINLAKWSRELYRQHVAKNSITNTHFSADLQKVIMLPRVDSFKKVLFVKRLAVYNESFVPLGTSNQSKPLAVLWHEGISGRNQEDLISAFYAFFRKQRDSESVTLWLDNCSSQNKNWCFASFLIYLVNSSDITANEINIHYFEPGHTFMSADSFHHQVELSLKRQGKTYDFADFVEAVSTANKSRVDVKEMAANDFYKWKSYVSQKKLKTSPNGRIYLRDIVQCTAIRGAYHLLYKISYDNMEPLNCLDFLQVKAGKPNGMQLPECLTQPCGFPREKRDNILKNLNEVLPENRKMFWLNIPTCD